jgi:hypothetical protein
VNIKTRLHKCPVHLPAWLYVNTEAIPGIIDALDFWSTTQQSTTRMLRDHVECTASDGSELLKDPLASSAHKEGFRIGLQAQRQNMYNLVDNLSDEGMVRGGFVRPGQSLEQARQEVARNRDSIVDSMLENQKNGSWPGRKREEEWYKITKVFIPPPDLRARHPGFESYESFRATGFFPISSQQRVCCLRSFISSSYQFASASTGQEACRTIMETEHHPFCE